MVRCSRARKPFTWFIVTETMVKSAACCKQVRCGRDFCLERGIIVVVEVRRVLAEH